MFCPPQHLWSWTGCMYCRWMKNTTLKMHTVIGSNKLQTTVTVDTVCHITEWPSTQADWKAQSSFTPNTKSFHIYFFNSKSICCTKSAEDVHWPLHSHTTNETGNITMNIRNDFHCIWMRCNQKHISCLTIIRLKWIEVCLNRVNSMFIKC